MFFLLLFTENNLHHTESVIDMIIMMYTITMNMYAINNVIVLNCTLSSLSSRLALLNVDPTALGYIMCLWLL